MKVRVIFLLNIVNAFEVFSLATIFRTSPKCHKSTKRPLNDF